MGLRKINKKKLLIGLGAVVVVFLVTMLILWSRQKPISPLPVSNNEIPKGVEDGQITQEQQAGEKSGYRIDISLDTVPLNPYPGSTTKGRISILNAAGQVATEVNGGVRLFVGETNDDTNRYGAFLLAGSTVVTGNEYGKGGLRNLVAGNWKVREDGSNIYDFNPTIREITKTDLLTAPNSSVSPCFESRFGSESPKADWLNWQWSMAVGQYIILTKGQGEFAYVNLGQANPLLLTAIADEEPIYPAADPQYKFTWNFSYPRQMVSDEPEAIKQARLAQISGYQVVGTPVHYRSADIVTKATIPVGQFSKFTQPNPPTNQLEYVLGTFRTDRLDYSYDVTFNPKQLNGQTGGKFTMTIKPKAKPNKALPHTIHDVVSLSVENGYATSPTNEVSRLKADWLARNYLAYFTGYNGQPLISPSNPSAYWNPSTDVPVAYGGTSNIKLGGPTRINIDAAGDVITLELTQTGSRSVMGFLAVRLTSRRAADNARAGASGPYSGCALGVDQIVSVPVN